MNETIEPVANEVSAPVFWVAPALEVANDQFGMYFEVYRVPEVQMTTTFWSGGEWRWRFCTVSGETIAASSGYETSSKCMDAVSALRSGAGAANIRQIAYGASD